jgi:signal transduction histidine kinase
MPFLQTLFSSGAFMPHGHCYLWQPGLVWLHVVSDVSIWLAYVAISATLLFLVRRVRDPLPVELAGSSISLEAPGSPPFPTDPRLFRLILVNLLGNAIKHGGPGQITVRVHADNGQCRLIVGDQGPGIPPDKQAMIFEPFAQLEPLEVKHTPGVGLGLALVREIVQALGGEVTLDSAPGRGSVFVVTLPAQA